MLKLVFLILLSFGDIINGDDLVVTTLSGKVRGKAVNVQNTFTTTRINAWLGIPYAEKPIGDLRFKHPVPVKPWSNELNAINLPNSCYQQLDASGFIGLTMWNPNTNMSEDCLYLNIWAPTPKPKNAAVMVNIK